MAHRAVASGAQARAHRWAGESRGHSKAHHTSVVAKAITLITHQTPYHQGSRRPAMWTGGAVRIETGRSPDQRARVERQSSARSVRVQWRRNTNVPLVPPNPKLFFTATSMRISRAVLAQ